MFYRTTELFKDTAMGASGTEIIDINVQKPISQLIIHQRSTGSGDVPTAHLAAVVSKIEIVDGSDVLYSLSGYEAQAFDFYHRKMVPLNANVYLTGVQGITCYVLNFGRYLWDELLAFSPGKFSNPQLKITYDRDAGGNNSSALELQVVAHLFDEKEVTPAGFLMHKEIKKYSLSNLSWEYTDLPTDYAYRMLMVQSIYPGKSPHSQFREMKLSEDVDKKIPFDFITNELIKFMQTQYPLFVENLRGSGAAAAADRTYYVTPAYVAHFSGELVKNAAGYVRADEGNGGTIVMKTSVAGNLIGLVQGFCPHGSVVVPFGKPDIVEDWYGVKDIGSLKLNVKGGTTVGSGSTAQICLQQYRPTP